MAAGRHNRSEQADFLASDGPLGPGDLSFEIRRADPWQAKRIVARVVEEAYRQGWAAGYEKGKEDGGGNTS